MRGFAARLQQFTGPLMAKSLEDTAFYRYNRLIALNEVGGEPVAPHTRIDVLHRRQQDLLRHAPHGLTATATHDTKRGEDARMRILALAELADDWRAGVARWSALNRSFLRSMGEARAPSAAHEYLLYQSLIGAWPLAGVEASFVARMQAYALKAAREAKQETSWTNPDADYEAALNDFVGAILDPRRAGSFIDDLAGFARRTALIGAHNSLSQLTLKCLLPGVPDFFQGTEFWDTSLVDPDNRRPVDYGARRAELDKQVPWLELIENWPNGRIKFALMRALLSIRNRFADLLREGGYEGVAVSGRHAAHVIGFARRRGRNRLVVLAGRHFAPFTDAGRHWARGFEGEVRLGQGGVQDLLRARRLSPDLHLREVFAELPVAVLHVAG